MRISRFYLPEDYQVGQVLPLSKEQVHYALTVLRMKDQRPIELFDGQGNQAQATLLVNGRRAAEVRIDAVSSPVTESPLKTILLQGISKGDRMDYSIQKCVELGITEIQPLFTENCDVKLAGDKLDKRRRQWQDIAINACEQSNRNTLPSVHPAMTLQEWLSRETEHALQGLVLNPYASQTLKTLNADLAEQPIHLLIGPEGGLTEAEVALAVEKGFTDIRIGPRILRTETAGVSILSALQTLWGDF